jgi:hypothetical protein
MDECWTIAGRFAVTLDADDIGAALDSLVS